LVLVLTYNFLLLLLCFHLLFLFLLLLRHPHISPFLLSFPQEEGEKQNKKNSHLKDTITVAMRRRRFGHHLQSGLKLLKRDHVVQQKERGIILWVYACFFGFGHTVNAFAIAGISLQNSFVSVSLSLSLSLSVF
jgi:hypothetical protein